MKNQDFDKLSLNTLKNHLKIVFFGTSDFAVPALKSLLNSGYKIVAAVTQSEKPTGRRRIIIPSPIKKASLENHIPVFEPHNLRKDEVFFKKFKSLNFNLCIIAAYGKIIPAQYLELPKYGFINIHPSLLPKYRGPSPIQTAIMNGDQKIGVTIIKIDEQMDHGPILGITNHKLQITDYYKEAEKELAEKGAKLLFEILPKYITSEIKPQKQDHAQATFTRKLAREDGRINWNQPAQKIYNQIRALNPEPGTWTTWYGKILNIMKINIEVKPQYFDKKYPGYVFRVGNGIAVATKTCYLILKQIQLEGGKEMDAKSFINGHPDFLNSKLE